MNIPFLLVGMRVLGVRFGPKTVFAAALTSLFIDVLRPHVPTVQGEPLLYILYGGLLYGLGMGLVFRADATGGGTEIPAKLLEHFRGHPHGKLAAGDGYRDPGVGRVLLRAGAGALCVDRRLGDGARD